MGSKGPLHTTDQNGNNKWIAPQVMRGGRSSEVSDIDSKEKSRNDAIASAAKLASPGSQVGFYCFCYNFVPNF